jgi:hypothetical protein
MVAVLDEWFECITGLDWYKELLKRKQSYGVFQGIEASIYSGENKQIQNVKKP